MAFALLSPAVAVIVAVVAVAIIIVIIEIAASSFSTVSQKGYHTWNNYYLSQPQYAELEDTIEELQANDNDEFYRIMNTESNRSFPNLPSQLNYNGAATFNSTYDFELDDFKHRSRMAYSGSWMMGNHEKRYWLDQYIGTKYYIIDKTDKNNDNSEFYRDGACHRLFFLSHPHVLSSASITRPLIRKHHCVRCMRLLR